MMITARGNESCLAPEALGQIQAEHTAIKPKCAVKVGDLEMHMADSNFGINRLHGSVCDTFYCSVTTLLLFARSRNQNVEAS